MASLDAATGSLDVTIFVPCHNERDNVAGTLGKAVIACRQVGCTYECEVESFVSFALHQDWHTVMFGSPEDARAARRRQGLNYFLLDLREDFIDVIQFSPLFCPDNIHKYLKVVWTKGDYFLLTWTDPADADEPPCCEFVGGYRDGLFHCPFDLWPLYMRMKDMYENNGRRTAPVVRDPSLPPVKGWQ